MDSITQMSFISQDGNLFDLVDEGGSIPELIADPTAVGDISHLHTYEDCETAMVELIDSRSQNAFELGDTMVGFEVNRGKPLKDDGTLSRLAAKLGYLPSQLSMWRAVSIFFTKTTRNFENVHWSHYYVAMRHADGSIDNALELLAYADTNGLSVARFKKYINGDDGSDDVDETPEEPPAGYAVVTGTGTVSGHVPASQNVTPGRDERVTIETPSGMVDAATGEVIGSAHVFGTGETSGADRSADRKSGNGSSEPPAGVSQFELYTPEWLANRVRLALGEIDLDPASSDEADKVIRANRFFNIEDNGLSQSWTSTGVFVFPPYGKSHNVPWVQKIVGEFTTGGAMKVIALLPAAVVAEHFSLFAGYPRCHLHERLAFFGPEDRDDGPRFDSVLVSLGVPIDMFAEAFEDVGDIYVRYVRGSK